MKKHFLLITAFCFTLLSAHAASDKVHVAAISEFNTANPSKQISVRVIEEGNIGTHVLNVDDVLHCNVVKVTDPKRGKRSASFAVCPISYTSDGQTKTIEENYYGKYASKIVSKEELKNIDAMKVGKKAAISVGNHFVKGIAPAVSLAEGMIKNEDGNRIKSGVKKVYKESPLSYVEKGKELQIEPNDTFYLVFKPSDDNNDSDVEQEIIEEEKEE